MAIPKPERDFRSGTVDYVVLVDEEGVPYKAQQVVQQVEGDFDATGLATEAKQDQQISSIEAVTDALGHTMTSVTTTLELIKPAIA